MNNLCKKDHAIDFAGLCILGIFSLGYIILKRMFAELHLALPFLSFPIFIGEIGLAISYLLFAIKYSKSWNQFHPNIWNISIIVYVFFFLFKAAYGYYHWGPLAFRHAALFYYPTCAILAYAFYREELFHDRMRLGIIFLIFGVFVFFSKMYDIYWTFALFLLAFILVSKFSNRRVKWALLILLFVLCPYHNLFFTSRMMLVANVIGIAFLMIATLKIMKLSRKVKLVASCLAIVLVSLGIFKFANKTTLKTLIYWEDTFKILQNYNAVLEEKGDSYKMMEIEKVKIFTPETELPNFLNKKELKEVHKAKATAPRYILTPKDHVDSGGSIAPKGESASQDQNKILYTPMKEYTPPENPYLASCTNTVFRLLIWRDLIGELYKQKPILGVDFGKPFRSRSLEMANIASGEWSRDGWIEPHNSYLNLIYRGGVVGIVFIIGMLFIFLRTFFYFLKTGSMVGIMLSTIIFEWLVAANFLVIFEMPYFAIPFWSLFGIMLAYYDSQKKKLVVQH
ncbi:MAG: hypothetical protein WC676_00330 [Candidatus Omnitrophota bacterium]